MELFAGDDTGVSPVIGVVLMVAITVALAAVVAIVVTSSGDQLSGGSANAKVEFEPTPSGLVLKVEQTSTEADVQINGRTIETISQDSAGKEIFLPTAPGDTITLVSGNREQSVLVSKTVDNSEKGDFIAYYRFDKDAGSSSSTVRDYSGNENDGDIGGSPSWTGNALEFDGNDDHVTVNSITSKTAVNELTYMASYEPYDADEDNDQKIVEHVTSGADEWFIDMREEPGTASQYGAWGRAYGANIQSEDYGKVYDEGEAQTFAATFDGSEYSVYINGEKIDTKRPSSGINMGDLEIAMDNGGGQEFEGKIYELRIYYTAMDDSEVKRAMRTMYTGG